MKLQELVLLRTENFLLFIEIHVKLHQFRTVHLLSYGCLVYRCIYVERNGREQCSETCSCQT